MVDKKLQLEILNKKHESLKNDSSLENIISFVEKECSYLLELEQNFLKEKKSYFLLYINLCGLIFISVLHNYLNIPLYAFLVFPIISILSFSFYEKAYKEKSLFKYFYKRA